MMNTTTLRRATSLSAAVTLLSTLAVPAMAAEGSCLNPSIVDGLLVCETPVVAEAPVVVEAPVVEEEASPADIACAIEIVDGAAMLVCAPNVPVVEAPVVVTPVVEAPVVVAPVVEAPVVVAPVAAELPLSLTDGLSLGSVAASEDLLGSCDTPGVIVVASSSQFGPCAPEAIFNGDAAGDLGMGNLLSRGQAAATISRMLDLTGLGGLPSGADHFSDDNGTVHEAALNEMADFGILRGASDGTVNAAGTVTGPQFASMLHRTLVHTGTFDNHVANHTASAAGLAGLGITLDGGELTRGDAAAALQLVLDHIQA